MSWLFFSLLTPFIYSLVNILDKYIVDKKVKYPVVVIPLYGLLGSLLGLILGLIRGVHLVSSTDMILLIFAGVLFVFYSWPYLLALQSDDASNVIPLFQLVSIFSLVLAAILLKELLIPVQLVGFALIFFAGIYLSVDRKTFKFQLKKSFYLMCIATFAYALGGVIIKYTDASKDYWNSLFYISIGMAIGSFGFLMSSKIRAKTREILNSKTVLALITLGNIGTLLAQLSQFWAYQLAHIALVNVVSGVQPVFILTIGVFLTIWFPNIVKENLSAFNLRVKFVAIAIIFLGIYVINYQA